MPLLRIAHGQIYDPLHGRHGEQRDLWIRDGVVVEPQPGETLAPDRVLDATGLVVMPGGVDMHCHIAGSKVNAARRLRPEEKRNSAPVPRRPGFRSGTVGSVPSTFATGYLYAGLGYTTAFDAAIAPLGARHAHEELQDTPLLDKGFYILTGNNHLLMQQLGRGAHEEARAFLGWLLHATQAYACKVVNPGGVEMWKQSAGAVGSLDDEVPGFNVSPRRILQGIARAVDELQLPHAAHIHCNQLGLPGNWKTTLETMHALEGHRGHLTHIQFHSYGGDADDQGTFCSRVAPLVEYVNSHPNLTVDVGQVVFGDTTSMTGDSAVGYFLQNIYGGRWVSMDTELEAGCGVVPIVYQNKSVVHALQWAIGLEWYLLMEDPWRIAMSTDHPNGGSFLAYPQIVALLMDRGLRRDLLQQLPAAVRERCSLAELTREYTLAEIAIITRAAPARILGLRTKGHLGPGADGDVTLYQPQVDKQRMFALPRYVIRAGEIVVDDGELRAGGNGRVWRAAPDYDRDHDPRIADWFNSHYSLRVKNYCIDDTEIPELTTATPRLDAEA